MLRSACHYRLKKINGLPFFGQGDNLLTIAGLTVRLGPEETGRVAIALPVFEAVGLTYCAAGVEYPFLPIFVPQFPETEYWPANQNSG